MKRFAYKFVFIDILSIMIFSLSYADKFILNSDSPCYKSIKQLGDSYYSKEDTQFKKLMDSAFNNMQ